MLSQLEQDFLHMKSGGKGLDQDGGADGTVCHVDVGLAEEEDVVPETSFEVVLHLGEVKVRA